MPEHQQIQQSKKTNTIFQKQATPISQTPASNPYSIIQRAKINPKSLTHADVMQLQRTIGNQAVGRLLSSIGNTSTAQQATVQRQEIPEEEEPLQGKMIETIQRQEIPEEEEPLQGKMAEAIQRQEIPEEEEPLQGKMIETIQRQEIPEEEEPLQGKFTETIQRQEIPEEEEPLQTKRENNTGMPDNLKAGVESLSGIDMSDVRVIYNSDKPAEVGALAYTQGTDIHVASGQEIHLPHEAWHVVQQKQGRVRPTIKLKGLEVNENKELEREASDMEEKAIVKQCFGCGQTNVIQMFRSSPMNLLNILFQPIARVIIEVDDGLFDHTGVQPIQPLVGTMETVDGSELYSEGETDVTMSGNDDYSFDFAHQAENFNSFIYFVFIFGQPKMVKIIDRIGDGQYAIQIAGFNPYAREA